MRQYDVVVVGGGPAGSVTAYRLAKAGARVALMDKARFPRVKPCGGGLDGIFWSYLPSELREDVRKVVEREARTMRFVWKGGPAVRVPIPRPASMTRRFELDRLLLRAAESLGVDVMEGERFREAVWEGGYWHIPSADLRARVLVGADGAYSRVARALGLRRRVVEFVASEWDVRPRVEWTAQDEVLIDATDSPLGYFWVFPKATHLNVGVGVPKRKARGIHDLTGMYAERWGAMGEHTRVAHHIPFALKGHQVAGPMAVLVGDAAGVADPATGGGIGWSVRQSQCAAGYVLSALSSLKSGKGLEEAQTHLALYQLDFNLYHIPEAEAGEALRNCLVLAFKLRRYDMAERLLRDILLAVSGLSTYSLWRRQNPFLYRIGRLLQRIVVWRVR